MTTQQLATLTAGNIILVKATATTKDTAIVVKVAGSRVVCKFGKIYTADQVIKKVS